MATAYPECFGISLLTNEAKNFSAANANLDISHSSPDRGKRYKWMVLGRFDHLALRLCNDRVEMAGSEYELSDSGENDQLSYYGHLSYYGKFSYPKDFDWQQAHDNYGLAGFCTIRVRQGEHSASLADDLRVGKAIQELLGSFDVSWVLGSTTGWDDHVVFLFSKSYNTILQALWKIRDFADTTLATADWLLTSCTLPLIRFDWKKSCEGEDNVADVRNAREVLLAKLTKIILPNEPIGWAVRFAVTPGKLADLEARVKQAAEANGLGITITKLFGQADFRCADANGTAGTQGNLIRFLVHVAFPLVTERETSIRNIETHLHLGIQDRPTPSKIVLTPGMSSTPIVPGVTAAQHEQKKSDSQFETDAVFNLQYGGIPQYTINALRTVFRRIDLLQNNDLLAGEFDSLINLRRQFNMSARSLRFSDLRGPTFLHQEVNDWLTGLEKCLADRYRGIYPTGESITMRMATYHASHQKFLRVADHLIDSSAKLSLQCIREQRRIAKLAEWSFPEITAVAHLGNSPTGQCADNLRVFGTSFIELPVSEVFNFGRSEVLLHETGHHVTKACLLCRGGFPLGQIVGDCAYTKEDRSIPGEEEFTQPLNRELIRPLNLSYVKCHFYELLAELFSCSIAFGGNVVNQWATRITMVDEVFSESRKMDDREVYERARFTYQVRNGLVAAIVNGLDKGEQILDRERCLREVSHLGIVAFNLKCTDIYQTAILAAQAFCELTKFSEFRAIILGISPAILGKRASSDSEILAMYRRLLANKDGGLIGSLDALREAWALVNLTQIREKS